MPPRYSSSHSGPLLARIHVGQTGTAADPVQREFSGFISGMQSVGLSVNVTIAQNNDIASMEVLGPDGQSATASKQIQPPRLARTFADEMSSKEQDAFYDTRAGQTLQSKIAYAIANSPKLQSLAYAYTKAVGQVAQTPAAPASSPPPASPSSQPAQQQEIVKEMAKEAVAMANAGVDTGSGFTIDISDFDPAATMNEVLRWYQGPTRNETSVSIHGTWVRNDTQAGRIFLGLYQNIWSGTDAEAKLKCAKVERVTGIPQQDLWGIARNHDADRFAQGLITFFRNSGFGDIFSNSADLPPLSEAHPLHVRTDDDDYTNGFIRVSWDQPLTINGKSIDHTRVYLVNAETKAHVMDVSGDIRGQLFTDIAVSSLGQSFTVPIAIKVVDWPVGATNNAEAISGFSDPITVKWDGVENPDIGDYSTLPDGAENKDEERIVLSLLNKSQHLYFDDLSSWTWSMASTAHDGVALNAIDLIRANADNAPVMTPFAGKVVFNGLDSGKNSTLVLEHHIDSGGRTIYWYTKYLHMHTNNDGLVYVLDANRQQMALTPGAELGDGATTGFTGSVGQSSGPHLHGELLITPNGHQIMQQVVGEKSAEFFTTQAVDQRLLLTKGDRKVDVMAEAGFMRDGMFVDRGNGRAKVEWHDDVHAWVDTANKLVYDRREQQNLADGNSTHWLAWEAGKTVDQMFEVMWVKVGETTESGKAIPVMRWAKVGSTDYITGKNVWNPSSQSWVDYTS